MEECCINFPGPVSRKTMSHLVIDYLKYILYYRGQFPLPLDQLTNKKRDNIILTAAEKSRSISSAYSFGIFCDETNRNIPLVSIPYYFSYFYFSVSYLWYKVYSVLFG